MNIKTTLEDFLNENSENIELPIPFENNSYKSFEQQFEEGKIFFINADSKQLYCVKLNSGFVGEVNGMWTLCYKGTYFSPVQDKINNLFIENDGFRNVQDLFNWLNPILIEYKKTSKWNAFAE